MTRRNSSKPNVSPAFENEPVVWKRRLQIGIPLGVSVLLLVVFAVLISRLWRQPEETSPPFVTRAPESPPPVAEDRKVQTVPVQDEAPAAESDSNGINRWNIDPLPKGWDPEIAALIAVLADAIDTQVPSPENLAAATDARNRLIELLSEFGPEALPTLDTILNAETGFVTRRHILNRIGEFGPETGEATLTLWRFYNKNQTNEKARSELNYVIKAMAKLQNDTSLSMLSDMVGNEGVREYDRGRFISALGDHHRAEERTDLFVDNMLNGNADRVRNYSAQALGKLAERRRDQDLSAGEFLPGLMDAFEDERRTFVRQTVLGSMGKIGDPASLSFLEEIARVSPDREIRLSAANAVRRIGQHSGSDRAWALLADLAQNEPDAAVRSRLQSWNTNH
jgi:HEAT repeat protein